MKATLAQAARRILASEAGEADSPSPEQIAAGAARACEKLVAQLTPLLGEVGVHTVYARALTLTSTTFSWLAIPGTAPSEATWARLRDRIATQPHDAAIEASVSLLASFMGLLGRFIGDGLTARLLRELWPDAFSPMPPEESS